VEICKRGHSKTLVKKQPEGCFLRDKVRHAQENLLYKLYNTTSTCISVLPKLGSTEIQSNFVALVHYFMGYGAHVNV